ncbi:PepSY domain-containing protein [Streptomyces sp. XY533]|uniref:PepSY domain-containing protein n=1 Tax=Streptomyces sp. XY533 TaxID=1519481 RepID=UPI0006AE3232|nr:PepSY domain-containing protein [Streptomyces sp. XY533]KOV08796.1 peptidase [Streptomyces sp. XY533]
MAEVLEDEITKLVEGKTILSLDELKAKALAKHPGATTADSELENENGRYIFKVELRDQQDVEWDLALDAKTGEVLKDQRDN